MKDSAKRAQWLAPSMIVHGCDSGKVCNAESSPAAAYVSERAIELSDIVVCIRLLMRGEQIVLAAFALLHLVWSGVVYDESKDRRVNRRGVTPPALRRDLKSAQQAREVAVAAAAKRDSVESKVKIQLAEMRLRVCDLAQNARDCEAMLKDSKSTCIELIEEDKVLNRTLVEEKNRE